MALVGFDDVELADILDPGADLATLPDRLGGMKVTTKQDYKSGIPILKDLPLDLDNMLSLIGSSR